MALDLKPVQVRLPEEAYDELALIATARDQDLGEVARELLIRMLLGEGHAVRLAAEKFSRALAKGNKRQRAVAVDKNQQGLPLNGGDRAAT